MQIFNIKVFKDRPFQQMKKKIVLMKWIKSNYDEVLLKGIKQINHRSSLKLQPRSSGKYSFTECVSRALKDFLHSFLSDCELNLIF